MVVLSWALACSGSPGRPVHSSQPTKPPNPVPARAEPSGPAEAVTLARLDPRCRLDRITVGADADPVRVGTLAGPCPEEVALTWTGDRVVAIEAGRLRDLGGGAVPAPPLRVDQAAFDPTGALHVCGTVPARLTVGGSDADTDYHGRRILGHRPRGAIGGGVGVPYTLGPTGWVEGSADLVFAVPTDLPGFAPCGRLLPEDGAFASSGGPSPTRWAAGIPADQIELGELSAGNWQVDPTRTVATRGLHGPQAAFWGGKWHRVGAVDAVGPWVVGDWVGVRDGAGFSLVSRRDGSVGYTSEAGTVVFPWPDGAPR